MTSSGAVNSGAGGRNSGSCSCAGSAGLHVVGGIGADALLVSSFWSEVFVVISRRWGRAEGVLLYTQEKVVPFDIFTFLLLVGGPSSGLFHYF